MTMQTGSRGTQACINAAGTIDGVVADLETTVMFASAGTLNPEPGETFANHRLDGRSADVSRQPVIYEFVIAVECNPGLIVNTHVPLSPSSIIWYNLVMPCGWEGNRRYHTCHASQTLMFFHLRAQGMEEGDEHPPPHTLSCRARLTLPFLL